MTYALATGGETENIVYVWPGDEPRPNKVYVGLSGGPADDHNNGALIIEPGRAPIVLYTRHADSSFPYIKYRIGDRPIEDGMAAQVWSAEQSITYTGGPTYPSAHVDSNGTIHLICRDDLRWWSYTKSTDWGATWATPVRFMEHTAQCHVASVLVQAGTHIRLAIGTHPSQGDEKVRYAHITTGGNVTDSNGTVLGNMDGTNLPLAVTTAFEVIGEAPVDHYKWVYDVSDGTYPEVAWSIYDSPDYAGTSRYKFTRKAGGVWTTTDIVAAGDRFSDSTQPYLGGVQMPTNTPGGRVYVARESAGTWYVERHDSADNGATWTVTPIGQSTTRLVRAWPVEQRGATAPPFEVVAELIPRFTSFKNMKSTLVVLPSDDY
mgnify:CR=1 FL=1